MVLTLVKAEEKPEAVRVARYSSERFWCIKSGRMYHWIYVDDKERVLVKGPEKRDVWEAHRLLLVDVAAWASSGRAIASDEEVGRNFA